MFQLLLVVACIVGSQAAQYTNLYDHFDHIDDVSEGDNAFDDQFDHIHEENDHYDYNQQQTALNHKIAPLYSSGVANHGINYAYDHSPKVLVNAPVVYAGHDHASPVVYAHGRDASVIHGDLNLHGYGTHGAHGYGSDYRFSGLHSPVTAGHYIGFGNKYGFRAGYPYGYGEMLNYTPAKGYSLESGWEKLMTRQPAKYSYNHGYVPLTPVHYKKGIKTLKH